MHGPLTWFGRQLADYLSQERPRGEQVGLVDPAVLAATLRPCDVLLVDGSTRRRSDARHLLDVSPYFDVVKPTIEVGFDYRAMRWAG